MRPAGTSRWLLRRALLTPAATCAVAAGRGAGAAGRLPPPVAAGRPLLPRRPMPPLLLDPLSLALPSPGSLPMSAAMEAPRWLPCTSLLGRSVPGLPPSAAAGTAGAGARQRVGPGVDAAPASSAGAAASSTSTPFCCVSRPTKPMSGASGLTSRPSRSCSQAFMRALPRATVAAAGQGAWGGAGRGGGAQAQVRAHSAGVRATHKR